MIAATATLESGKPCQPLAAIAAAQQANVVDHDVVSKRFYHMGGGTTSSLCCQTEVRNTAISSGCYNEVDQN